MKTCVKLVSFVGLAFVFLGIISSNDAAAQAAMRRPISPSQPMWLVHIDSWNTPDPKKIIDLIPADIRPYVVMNISLSINHDDNTGAWNRVEYGYETAKSWLRTCAENQLWAMIQPSSGGYSHFSETDITVYKEFYENYPNFIGFNYAEPFWGFDETYSCSWAERVANWVNLINLADTYGGYLVTNWCGAYYGASMNPVAMLKRNAAFASVLQTKSDHFIMCEKYTSKYGFYDIESTSLGMYLSGYSGHYGIRFDQCGWTGDDGVDDGDADDKFPVPTGVTPIVEHLMLTGETVIDGPELIWQQCFRELSTGTTTDGFTTRRWDTYPQFNNISIDIFRKILDGTIRIMSKREVIDRTKLVIVNDVTSGADVDKYSSPYSLYEGLYRMDNFTDPNTILWNRNWYKKTGRYPTIPVVYQLNGTDANSFQVKVNKSAYATRWPSTSSKVTEFDGLFSQEYTGTIYAARHENGWVVYNPLKTATTATGNIPLKYNTCTSMDLGLQQFTTGVVKEYTNKITFYLTNYDNTNTAMKTDVITINGCSAQPTYTVSDRAVYAASTVTSSYSGGVFTLNVTHNGALDITVNCSGSATGRLTAYTTATISTPVVPAAYTGPRQYEAEVFDYKSIAGNVANGATKGIANYTGLGYLQFGTNAAAGVKATVQAQNSGTFKLETKYSVVGGDVSSIDLYVNGTKVATPTFTATGSTSTWAINTQSITLNAGTNTITFQANKAGSYSLYFDNIVLTSTAVITTNPPTVTSPVTYCQNASASALTATGTSLKWYTTATGGTGATTAPTPSTLSAGTTTYYVTQTLNSIESSRAAISVVVNAVPEATITPQGNTSFCSGQSSVALKANTGTGLTYQWRNGTTAVGTGAASLSVYYSSGSYSVDVTDANNCTATSSAVVVTVNPIPSSPTATGNNPLIYCQNTTITELTANGTALTWYTVETGGTGTSTAPVPATQNIDTTSYYVSQTLNGCESSRLKLDVIVNPTLDIALNPGWNLISTNVHPKDSSIETLFKGLGVLEVKSMNAFWRLGQPAVFNSLSYITSSEGYFVYMNTAGTLSVCGTPVSPILRYSSATAGWKLIGCPYQNASLFSTDFDASNCSIIKNFDGFWQPGGGVNSINYRVPGKGYFIK